MKIHECEQGTIEWWNIRCRMPTASNFNRILTPAKLEPSKQATDYALEIVASRMYLAAGMAPQQVESYTSRDMQAGIDTEPEARARFQLSLPPGREVRTVGFLTDDHERIGCSPDGLIFDEDGIIEAGLELKCPTLRVHLSYLMAATLPPEYRLQVHGSLAVSGLPAWCFVSYHPMARPLILCVQPDETTEAIRTAAMEFVASVDNIEHYFAKDAT